MRYEKLQVERRSLVGQMGQQISCPPGYGYKAGVGCVELPGVD